MPDDKKKGFSWDDEEQKPAATPGAGAAPGSAPAGVGFSWDSEPGGAAPDNLSPEHLAEMKTRAAQPTQIEKEQTGKGYITPEQEEQDKTDYAWYAPEVSALRRRGLMPGDVLSSVGTGLKNVAGSTLDMIKDVGSKSWGDLAHKYILDPADQEKHRSELAYERGDTLEGIGHGVAAGLPMIGPWAAGHAEQLGEGNIGKPLGETLGEVAGGKALSKIGHVLPEVEEAPRPLPSANAPKVRVKAPPIVEDVKSVGQKAADVAGNPYNIGLSGTQMLKQGVSPRARATGWDAAVRTAQDDLKRYHDESPITTPEQFVEALPEIKDQIWKEEIEPILVEQGARPVVMKPVASAVRQAITPEMMEFDEGNAAELQKLADKLEATRDVTGANRLLKYVNGKLESYFSKYPTARRANLMNNPETAGWEAARRALRNQFLTTLEDAGATGVRGARQRYGALETIENEAQRRPNVAGRRKPMSLPRILGLFSALPTAGLGFAAGELAHRMGEPAYLIHEGMNRLPPAAPKGPVRIGERYEAPAPIPEAAEQLPLDLPPESAPLFNLQQTPRLRPDAETARLEPIRGEQQELGLPPENAPLFNLQVPTRGPGPERIGGVQDVSNPTGLGPQELEAIAPQPPTRPGFAKAAPPEFREMLAQIGWEYGGKSGVGLTEFKEPGTNISISVPDRDLTPEKVAARIEAKLKEFNRAPKPAGRS